MLCGHRPELPTGLSRPQPPAGQPHCGNCSSRQINRMSERKKKTIEKMMQITEMQAGLRRQSTCQAGRVPGPCHPHRHRNQGLGEVRSASSSAEWRVQIQPGPHDTMSQTKAIWAEVPTAAGLLSLWIATWEPSAEQKGPGLPTAAASCVHSRFPRSNVATSRLHL